jgi:cation diffusion facilitator CzcD-associated flavoprotein CzcO
MNVAARVAREADSGELDVVVVGAGFAGLYALHKLRGLGHSVVVYEAGTGVGGTWYWNRYPGARVDIESREYSYSFSAELEHEWKWTEQYASQPELEAYANHVADRFDLRRDIRFETRVTSAVFDEASGRWTIKTDRGDEVRAKYCVMATGCLSIPKDIDLPGIETFKGEVYRTSLWPKQGVDFAGKRVAIVGTGSSGIQSIPVIAEQAGHVTVFQRTPNFSLPSNNGPIDKALVEDWLANREEYRRQQRESVFGAIVTDVNSRSARDVSDEERRAIYEKCWADGGFGIIGTFNDLLTDKWANDTASDFVREKIRGLVKDPATADKLLPRNHPIVTKRPCVDTGYFQTYNRDNVDLVDLKAAPIETVTASGIRAGGKDYEFDMLVLAIGFDAMTGALTSIDIRGRGGALLKDAWANGPRTYLGLMVAGFPNLFIITGPGSPSVLTNMIVSIEQHVEWIADCIGYLDERQLGVIEAKPDAQEKWVSEVNEAAEKTLYPLANSWYLGDNVPGKPHVFMPYIGGWKTYRDRCNDIAANDYEGFDLTSPATAR